MKVQLEFKDMRRRWWGVKPVGSCTWGSSAHQPPHITCFSTTCSKCSIQVCVWGGNQLTRCRQRFHSDFSPGPDWKSKMPVMEKEASRDRDTQVWSISVCLLKFVQKRVTYGYWPLGAGNDTRPCKQCARPRGELCWFPPPPNKYNWETKQFENKNEKVIMWKDGEEVKASVRQFDGVKIWTLKNNLKE